jgi:hypothetical protein
LHPEIQRQAANIRTDLDRFSLPEISSLVRHGYCVGRKACRARPDLFGEELPDNGPWDPIPESRDAVAARPLATGPSRLLLAATLGRRVAGKGEPAPVTVKARTLQASAFRRIWSTLLDYRDWTSYVYVPLIIPFLILLPYFGVKFYQRSHRINQLMESLSQSSPDLERMSRLLEAPMQPWTGDIAEEVRNLEEPDLKGFEILQDSHILDLRKWTPTAAAKTDPHSALYGYRRLKVFKQPQDTGNNLFRIRLLPTSPLTQVRFPPQRLNPRLRMSREENLVSGEKKCRWEASVDFGKVPAGESVELLEEHLSPADFLQHNEGSTTLTFEIQVQTAELTRWILMPEGREYRSFSLVRYERGKPEKAEAVKFVTEYLAEDYTILAFKLLSLKPGYTYELSWYYK